MLQRGFLFGSVRLMSNRIMKGLCRDQRVLTVSLFCKVTAARQHLSPSMLRLAKIKMALGTIFLTSGTSEQIPRKTVWRAIVPKLTMRVKSFRKSA